MDTDLCPCDRCSKPCKPRRCTRCLSAGYCSRECQRLDWKVGGHKQRCRRSSPVVGPSVPAAASPTSVAAVRAAEAELVGLVFGPLAAMSLDEAHRECQKATEVVRRLEEEEEEEETGGERVVLRDESGAKQIGKETEEASMTKLPQTRTATTDEPPANAKSASKDAPNGRLYRSATPPQRDKQRRRQQLPRPSVFDHVGPPWRCLVERLPHVSCYSVTLTLDGGGVMPCRESLRLTVRPKLRGRGGATVVRLFSVADSGRGGDEDEDVLVALSLPGRIDPNVPGTRLTVDIDSVSLRLPYGTSEESAPAMADCWYDDDDLAPPPPPSDPKDLSGLRCRSCGHSLLEDGVTLNSVLPLPVGCWDEVADYLTCYEGQPAFDFGPSSTVTVRGGVLEDGNVLVLHREDLGNNICVLAFDGYGEKAENSPKVAGDAIHLDEKDEQIRGVSPSSIVDADKLKNGAEYRGLRPWRDAVGGATLCCSQCCSTLGFASIYSLDACRLFKHRLSAWTDAAWTGRRRRSKGVVGAEDIFAGNNCASFLARDMVRYAESQAVFTFVVSARAGSSTNGGCLLMRLLSWDTLIATSSTSIPQDGTSPCLAKGIKLIFEYVKDIESNSGMGATHDLTSWTWGGVDLCCPPRSNGRTSTSLSNVEKEAVQSYGKASVQIFLTDEELSELKEVVMKGSCYFSDSVRKATVMLKLGKEGGRGNAGLSVISLA